MHTRFRKGQFGNPGGRSQEKLHALLGDAALSLAERSKLRDASQQAPAQMRRGASVVEDSGGTNSVKPPAGAYPLLRKIEMVSLTGSL
jgi:hypothetical protein